MTRTDNAYKLLDKPNTHLKQFPGDYGFPLIGKAFDYYKDWDDAIQSHVEKYGAISRIQVGPFKALSVSHPDHLQKVLIDKDKNFSNEMGWKVSLGFYFAGGLALRDFDEHRAHRRIFQTSFKTDAMRGYAKVSTEVIEDYLVEWEKKGSVDFADAITLPIMDIASRTLFGFDDLKGEANRKITRAFQDVIHIGTLGVVKWDIPGFKHHVGAKANRFLDKFVATLIPERRLGNGNDCMSYMVKERDENGNYFSDQDLVSHLKFLMFASFDTTSTALLHTMLHLAQDPELQERMHLEAKATGKEVLDYDDLDSMEFAENCIMESTRLYPPIAVLFRRTINDVQVGDYHLPANTTLMCDLRWSHRSEEFWTNANAFEPDRWGPVRAEHKRHSMSFSGFGGGAHKCLGMHFAKMEAKLFLHRFFLKYRVSLPASYKPKLTAVPLPSITNGLPLIIEKR